MIFSYCLFYVCFVFPLNILFYYISCAVPIIGLVPLV